jgi:hypothetical protein
MMYGLRGGLGEDTIVTDPVTGQVKVVTSGPITTETVSSSGQSVYTDSSGNVVFAPSVPASFTSWLNANSTYVAIGAAAFIGLLLFAKAGR